MPKSMRSSFRVASTAVVVVALLMTVFHRAAADASKAVVDEAVAPAPVAADLSQVASSAPRGVPREGIKVHGHWRIEVRNPDGTVVEVREFENALASAGMLMIPQVLGRARSVGGWAIVLASVSGSSAFSFGTSQRGMILENGGVNAPSGPGYFPTLTTSVTGSGLAIGDDKCILSGTATAQFDGNIGTVSTYLVTRPSTEAPSSTYGSQDLFTRAVLVAPISLLAGQQVLVTVSISFS